MNQVRIYIDIPADAEQEQSEGVVVDHRPELGLQVTLIGKMRGVREGVIQRDILRKWTPAITANQPNVLKQLKI